MILIFIGLFFTVSVYMLIFQLGWAGAARVHLSAGALADNVNTSPKEETPLEPIAKTWLGISKRFKTADQRVKVNFVRRSLIKAGSPMGALEFIALKILSMTAVPTISLMLLGDKFPREIVLVVALLAGFLLPDLWLKRLVKIRQHNIRKTLPNIIDLLNLCVSGGMDFMLSVNRVVRELRPCDLTRELGEVYRQTQVGKTRREALKSMAWRIDMPEIHSFVRTLVQADRMGSPMADALKIQAEEVRTKRFHRGEAMALKAPIKLLLPLFAFILPVVLVIVGGPIILDFVRNNLNIAF